MASTALFAGGWVRVKWWCWARDGAGRFADRVRKRFEIIDPRDSALGVDIEPEHLPATRRGQPVRMDFAQVVGVRFGVCGQRADDRGGV
jgi:hypothetical protein